MRTDRKNNSNQLQFTAISAQLWAERQAISGKGKLQGQRMTEINSLPPSDRTVYFLNSFLRHFIPKYSSDFSGINTRFANDE